MAEIRSNIAKKFLLMTIMRTLKKSIFQSSLMILLLALSMMGAQAAAITITSPNGGECLQQGAVYTINWTQSGVDHAALYYTTDGGAAAPTFGSWFFMFNSGDSSTSYNWTVPASADSDLVQVWAEGHDAAHTKLVIDSSDSNLRIKPSCQPDTTPPNVSVNSPLNGSIISGSSVTISAIASDNVGVAGVQFKLDSQNLGLEDTSSPYSAALNTTAIADGAHTITATARDAAGNTATSSPVTVTVSNADTTAPSISSVASSSITSGSATITWDTNESSDTQVDYGLTASYSVSTILNATLSASHSQILSGLASSTLYHYRIKSKDAAGNLASSGDFTFTTLSGAFDFTLSNGGTRTAAQGVPATNTITANLSSGIAQSVSYSALGLPAGAIASFSPASCSPACTTTITISTASNTTLGNYTINVTGTASLITRSTNFSLAISQGADMTPPVRSNGQPSGTFAPNSTLTIISLTTNEAAACKYSTIPNIAYTSMSDVFETTGDTTHSTTISVLTGASNYIVRCIDRAGNANTDDFVIAFSISNLSSSNLSDIIPPAISAVAASSITASGATITWSTSEDSSSQIDYGTSIAYGNSTAADDNRVIFHSKALSQLSPSALYHYRVKSGDAAGNLAISGDFTFMTLNGSPPLVLITPPIVNGSAVSLNFGKIDAGLSATLPLNGNRSAVQKLTVEAKTTIANAEFKILDLETNPLNISPPSKKIYKYLQLNNSIDSSYISKITIQFKVPVSWMNNNDVKENEIMLFHYKNNLWSALPTEKITSGDDNNRVYQAAASSGFSTFAIGANDTAPAAPLAEQNTAPVIEEKSYWNYWPYAAALALPAIAVLGFLEIKITKFRKREKMITRLKIYILTNLKKGYTLQQIKYNLLKHNLNNGDIEEAIIGLGQYYK